VASKLQHNDFKLNPGSVGFYLNFVLNCFTGQV